VEGPASADLSGTGVKRVRYRKGTIVLDDLRDYPLLRFVLHSGFVTADQLYAFMKLEHRTSSRNEFGNRVRRLLEHQLLVRREIRTISRGVVYSLTRAGESEMIGRGEFFAGATDKVEASSGHLQHALELNEIHLALKQSGMLVRWTPGSDIRSRNEFTNTGYAKDYDALVDVSMDGVDCRFALEYERTPKAKKRYVEIHRRIETESELSQFLYLTPNQDLQAFLLRVFGDCRRAVHFGLRKDFLCETLELSVRNNRTPLSMSFRTVLAATTPSFGGRATTRAQKSLF